MARALLPLTAVGAITAWLAPVGEGHLLALSILLHALLGTLLWISAPPHLPSPGIGWANRVTLLRASLVLPLAALLPWWGDLDARSLWWVIAVGSVILVLDGVDGRVARRSRTETAWGARFDMELDAVLILVLATGGWLAGRVGPWILLAGALRYLFVIAGWIWPRLTAPLPESFRRKAICVVQGIALLVVLGPIVPEGLALAAGLLAVGSLLYSFGVDTLWLLTRAPRRPASDALRP